MDDARGVVGFEWDWFMVMGGSLIMGLLRCSILLVFVGLSVWEGKWEVTLYLCRIV